MEALEGSGMRLRNLAVVLLMVQNFTQFMLMHLAQAGGEYSSAVAVVCQEVIKIVVAFLFVVWLEAGGSFHKACHLLHEATIGRKLDFLKLAVPGFLYAIQNNLLYVAVSNLDAATAQVLSQLKILTTAVFSVLILGKRLSRAQWGALTLLAIGAALVQLSTVESNVPPPSAQAAQVSGNQPVPVDDQVMGIPRNWVGLAAVLTATCTSGFAGVYFELMLKRTPTGVWTRNVQLGVFGVVFGSWAVFAERWSYWDKGVVAPDLFAGFSPLAWITVGDVAVGGLLVALVVRYADNLVKTFATSASIVLSAATTTFIEQRFPAIKFMVGACFVMGAAYIYSMYPVQSVEPVSKPHAKAEHGKEDTDDDIEGNGFNADTRGASERKKVSVEV